MVHFSAARPPRLATQVSLRPAFANSVKFGAHDANGNNNADKPKGWELKEAVDGTPNIWAQSKPFRVAAGTLLGAIGLSILAAVGSFINEVLNDDPPQSSVQETHETSTNPKDSGVDLDKGQADFGKEGP